MSRILHGAPLSSSKSFTATTASQGDESVPTPRLRDTQLTEAFGPESQTGTESHHMISPGLSYKGSQLVERIKDVLHKRAIYLTSHSISLVIEEYEKRRVRYGF